MRIAFVTDIHIGAAADGFQMQPRWIEGIPTLLDGLIVRLGELRPDLTIIGGDIVENGVTGQIAMAASFLSQIPGRTLVCLGNHDLTRPDSLEIWRESIGDFPRLTLADALIQLPECDVIGLNTHWLNEKGEPELRWTSGQYPLAAAAPTQMKQLDECLGRSPGRPAILAMHAQLNGVPAAICGQDKPFEPPTPSFEASIRPIMDRHPRLIATLSGHCHASCAIRNGSRVEITGTSFTETPFQFHLLELSGGRLTVHAERIACTSGPALIKDRLWVCAGGE